MSEWQEPDYGAAYYRSLDAIKNLEIRVTLNRITSASIVPQAEIEKEQGGNVEMLEIKKRQNITSQRDSESYKFSWQEKVFSEREVRMYADRTSQDSVLEREYSEETKQYRDGKPRPTKRIFSYVNHDTFTNKDENIRKMTTDPNEQQTLLAKKMANLRHRSGGIKVNKNNNKPRMSKFNIVDKRPSEELMKQNHYMSAAVSTMYIMADLSQENKESTEADEFVLVTIKFDAHGVISIKPDFNTTAKPYKQEAIGLGRDVYSFTIQHASYQLSRLEQEKENRMYKELYSRHTNYLSSLVGHDFELPPSGALRLMVYGEIVSAQKFEYNDLYIHYFTEPHQPWHAVGARHLFGITQVCTTKTIGRDEVAYFSFPFQFELIYKPVTLDGVEAKELFPKWPTFYIEVMSLDKWERYRTEGYGYTVLPSTAGIHTEEIPCWRPRSHSCVSSLKRFFIGGSPELEDPTYPSVPSGHQGKLVSKFGFHTISTGSVTVKFNMLQQSQAFLRSATSRKKAGHLLEHLGTSQAHADIGNILDAFQRAKKIMISTRNNLHTEYIETIKALDDIVDDE